MKHSANQNSTLGFYIRADSPTNYANGVASLSWGTGTIQLSKGGAAFVNVAPTVTGLGNGIYWIAPNAAHRDTLGEICWRFVQETAVIAERVEKITVVNDQTARFGAAAAGDAMALTSGERTTFAGILEAAMLNEADGQALLAGIQAQLQAIFDQSGDVPVVTLVNQIVAGVWANASRTITGTVTLASSQPNYAPAKAGDAMALTSGERTTFAGVLEAAMLNDSDGQALLAGMTTQLQSIFDQAGDVPIATLVNLIVSGVWANATRTLTSLQNVTVGGYAVGQDPGTLLSGTVTKVTAIDALLAALTEVVSAVTRFKATALSQAPGSAGGLTTDQQNQLNRIEGAAAQITGARLDVAGSVTPGGTIQLIVGKDYVTAAGSGLNRTVSDPGATLYNQLTSSTLAAVKRFAARRPAGGPTITGTIGTVTHSNGITTIPIEITRDAIPETVPAAIDYRYIVERETSDGKKVPVLMDDLTLERAPI